MVASFIEMERGRFSGSFFLSREGGVLTLHNPLLKSFPIVMETSWTVFFNFYVLYSNLYILKVKCLYDQ